MTMIMITTAETQTLALAAKNDGALVEWAQECRDSKFVGQTGLSPAVAAREWLRYYPVPLGHGYKPWALGADARARAWRDAEMWRDLVRAGGRELGERIADVPAHEIANESLRMAQHGFSDVAEEQQRIAAYRSRTA